MKIFDNEYGFLLTVGAVAEISKLCPDGDLSKIGEILEQPYAEVLSIIARMAEAMSRGYAVNRKMFYPCEAEWSVLTAEAVHALPPDVFAMVRDEILKAFSEGLRTNISAADENLKKTKIAKKM